MTVKVKNYNIVQARWRRGLKQVELARITGLDQRYISDIERGKCGISPTTAKKLADALGVDVDAIVSFDEPAKV